MSNQSPSSAEAEIARTVGRSVCFSVMCLCLLIGFAIKGCADYNIEYQKTRGEYARNGLNPYGFDRTTDQRCR